MTQYDEWLSRYKEAEHEKTPCPPERHINKREHAEIAEEVFDGNKNRKVLKWVYIEPI